VDCEAAPLADCHRVVAFIEAEGIHCAPDRNSGAVAFHVAFNFGFRTFDGDEGAVEFAVGGFRFDVGCCAFGRCNAGRGSGTGEGHQGSRSNGEQPEHLDVLHVFFSLVRRRRARLFEGRGHPPNSLEVYAHVGRDSLAQSVIPD
jgi:hypothetical protein